GNEGWGTGYGQRCGSASPIRRNLFGPVDHDSLLQEFQSMMRSSLEQAKQRWNFDFFQEMPVVGLLQWEELQGHEVPAFYHTHVARESRPPLQPMNRAVDREENVHLLGREAERGRPIKMATLAKKRRQTYLTGMEVKVAFFSSDSLDPGLVRMQYCRLLIPADCRFT
uniref:Cyclin-dependent kinase inhibitor domain-containing protein n=1 Tax=Pseudonaja textilis TaxID=8673 RepID=A0A670Y122_PSETE